MPYTLGWHPYFESQGNVANCQLNVPLEAYYEVNDQMIPTKEIPFVKSQLDDFNISQYDTCFKTGKNPIQFSSEKYTVCLESYPDPDRYLQIYTPDHQQSIAVEPMTGIANAFNNQIGLKTIDPGEKLHKTWRLTRLK